MTRPTKGWLFVALVSLTMPLASASQARATSGVKPPPPPPPAVAPAGLTATAGNARVALSWQTAPGATGYKVFRSVAGVWAATPIATTSGASYTNTGLANGTWYTYKVAAYNAGGVGPFSNKAGATPMAPPAGLAAASGDRQVALTWQPTAGAVSYTVLRGTSSTASTLVPVAANVAAPGFTDTGLTNGTRYYYGVRAVTFSGSTSPLSTIVSATPQPPPPAAAPANLVGKAGNARIELTWDPVAGATRYRVYRTTTGVFDSPPIATVSTTAFTNTGLTNGTTYSYRIAARNDGGDGPPSAVVTATPVAPPPAPIDVTATAGDGQVILTWTPASGATGYKVYRGTRSGREASTPVAADVAGPSYIDSGLENGPTLYYKLTATNAGGESPRSAEVSATPEGPPLVVDPQTTAAFRLLRQTTWGPRPGDVDHVKQVGASTFLDEQFAAPASTYPDTLLNEPVEASQEHFMQLALTGNDQLRQRVAWALHKIWVVSAVEVDSAPAIVTYYRLLMDGAFGNYRDLMHAITLNPAMGRYLNMLNNRSQQVTGVPPNENYPREVIQLFTLGIPLLNADGTPKLDQSGAPLTAYTEADVKELARIFTGWTFGDGNPARAPRNLARENFKVPMEAVEAFHDAGAKVFLGQQFPAGQSAAQDVDQALDVLFEHPNMAPFVGRQLIQQLVTSNPSPAYVADIAAVFDNNGSGVRGDLAAVVRAILTHPEAAVTAAPSGKLAEPVLFIVSLLRALGAVVTDHPFMSDKAEEMGQKVFYPPSVFSYFLPGYRVRGTASPGGQPLAGPEFQILTSVTSLVRANFVGDLLARHFGSDVTIDYTPFTSLARDAAALVDACNLMFMGGRMSPAERDEIIAAVRASSSNTSERAQTALYLTLVIAQSQVDR